MKVNLLWKNSLGRKSPIDSFSEIRQAGGILDRSVLPAVSPHQLYAELENALNLLNLFPKAKVYRTCKEIETYMERLRTAL